MMITVSCAKCGKTYSLDDKLGGRQGKCKKCGTTVSIPERADQKIVISFDSISPGSTSSIAKPAFPTTYASPPVAHKPNQSPRTRRLLSDAQQVRAAFHEFTPIRIRSIEGDPPDYYQLEYFVGGLARDPKGRPTYREQHIVEIRLTSEYPRQGPMCKMLTPVFHPNIIPSVICIADTDWSPAEKLVDLIVRIAKMIAYQDYNVKSPWDGEAAMWADQNKQHLPIDSRDFMPPSTV